MYAVPPHMSSRHCPRVHKFILMTKGYLFNSFDIKFTNALNVFVKEDFQSMTYGFKMAGQVTETRVAGESTSV